MLSWIVCFCTKIKRGISYEDRPYCIRPGLFFLPVHWRYDEPYGGRNNYRYAGEVQRSIASAGGRWRKAVTEDWTWGRSRSVCRLKPTRLIRSFPKRQAKHQKKPWAAYWKNFCGWRPDYIKSRRKKRAGKRFIITCGWEKFCRQHPFAKTIL